MSAEEFSPVRPKEERIDLQPDNIGSDLLDTEDLDRITEERVPRIQEIQKEAADEAKEREAEAEKKLDQSTNDEIDPDTSDPTTAPETTDASQAESFTEKLKKAEGAGEKFQVIADKLAEIGAKISEFFTSLGSKTLNSLAKLFNGTAFGLMLREMANKVPPLTDIVNGLKKMGLTAKEESKDAVNKAVKRITDAHGRYKKLSAENKNVSFTEFLDTVVLNQELNPEVEGEQKKISLQEISESDAITQIEQTDIPQAAPAAPAAPAATPPAQPTPPAAPAN